MDKAFFIFGPRGTGKSTWIKQNHTNAHVIDLLPARGYLPYLKDPSLLEKEILALDKKSWIVIDEIQKVPALLSEVQNLMENHQYKNFILTGSSARKLRRGGGNLLAGRASLRYLFALTAAELNFSISLDQLLNYGSLPSSINALSDQERSDFLNSYLETYLREEIREEGLVRDLGSFARFLDIAALASAQVTNMQGIARDSGITRNTIRGFFEILEDTLLGRWLPAYRPRAKIKEIAHPKFYWFDVGVLNVIASRFRYSLPADWKGIMLETWIHQELCAYIHYQKKGGSLRYWRTQSGTEVDFIWEKDDQIIGIEVKSADHYRSNFKKGICALRKKLEVKASYIVYLGTKKLYDDEIQILPALTFVQELVKGNIL